MVVVVKLLSMSYPHYPHPLEMRQSRQLTYLQHYTSRIALEQGDCGKLHFPAFVVHVRLNKRVIIVYSV